MSLKSDIEKAIKANSVKRLEQACIKALGKTAENIVNDAKENLRKEKAINNGQLLNSIFAQPVTQELKVVIEASAFYASFIEFGTRKFAAEQVGKLPREWQDIASKTKGKTRGTYDDMIDNLAQWVKDKGLAGRYSTKTKKRLGNELSKAIEDRQVAYQIAKWILIRGIRARPYLYPAVTKNINNFRKELDKVFK